MFSPQQHHDRSNPPIFLKIRSSNTFILSTICIAIFTDVFLYAVIVPVIPFALHTRVGTPETQVQHQVSVLLAVYGATLLAGSPVCGFLADRAPSRRLPLLLGLLALAGSTLLLCLGTNMAALLVGRALQGLSAAVVWTVGLALLTDTVGGDNIGQAMGSVTISMSAGTLVAPLVGGIVYNKAGYYPVYYMCFGMIILDIFLRTVLIEKKVARRWLDSDGVPAIRSSPSERQEKVQGAVTSPDGTAFSAAEPKAVQPAASPEVQRDAQDDRGMVPRNLPLAQSMKIFRSLLSSRRLLAALYCSLVSAILLTAWDATLPLFVSELFHWDSIGSGLIFLPLIIPALLAPLVGYWTDKKGPKWPTVLGLVLALPCTVLLRYVDHGGIRQIVLLCALLALIGFAIALTLTPLEAEIAYLVKQKEQSQPGVFGGRGAYATAFGLFNTAFAGGMLAGPLWGGLIKQRAGWGTMCWTLGLLSFVTAVPAFFFVGGAFLGKKKVDERREEARSQEVEV